MTTDNFSFGFAILTRLVALMLASCALVACAGHAPTRPAAVVPSVRGHGSGNTERSEAEVKRDLAKNERNTLSVSEAGYYLDVLQARLVQALGADVKLSRTPDRIGIDLAHRVPFESRGPWISEASCRLLQPLASALVEYRKTAVVVKVGANGTGKDAERLEERRAHAVAECLSRFGIALRRIVIMTTPSAEATPATDVADAGLVLDVELILRDGKRGR